MTETSLATRALERLRSLAEGNGLASEAIELVRAEEDIYTLDGIMKLEPLIETQVSRYSGGVRGRDREVLADAAALRQELERRQKSFQDSLEWLPVAVKQLREQTAEGWGLDNVRIDLPGYGATLAASETCPACQGNKMLICGQCQGQGSVICTHCQGQKQEFCPTCAGRGVNPLQPEQPCVMCSGRRFVPCRFCNGIGALPCPTCHGRRGTVCTTCGGAGMFTEEIALTCGARTGFTIKGEGYPVGLRRGLSRIGIENLGKGYADIETLATLGPEKKAPPAAPGFLSPEVIRQIDRVAEEPEDKTPKKEIYYRARLPYADLQIGFDGKKALISAFGKRCILMGVPPFLDEALQPYLAKLRLAATGNGNLDEALEARAMRDALGLQLEGKRQANDLRRIYTLGLTPEVAARMLADMRLALNQATRRRRTLVAVFAGIFSATLFAGIFLTPLYAAVVAGWPMLGELALDFVLLSMVMAGNWFALNYATRHALQGRFSGHKIVLTQSTGKTGMSLFAVIAALFVVILLLAPVKPLWLAVLLRALGLS